MGADTDLLNVLKNLYKINQIYDTFISAGKNVIIFFFDTIALVKSDNPIILKKDGENLVFHYLDKSFMISINIPVQDKDAAINPSSFGKFVTYLIINDGEKELINSLTFYFDYKGNTFYDSVPCNEFEFILKYFQQFNKYMFESGLKSSITTSR